MRFIADDVHLVADQARIVYVRRAQRRLLGRWTGPKRRRARTAKEPSDSIMAGPSLCSTGTSAAYDTELRHIERKVEHVLMNLSIIQIQALRRYHP
jgi:hypothetical protein